jgi:hypothetical protein
MKNDPLWSDGEPAERYPYRTGSGEQADYASRRVFQAPDNIPVVLDGKEVGQIAVAELLP